VATLMGAMSVGDIILLVLGGVMIIFGVRGPPGMRRLMQRNDIVGTWRHGALVFGALMYSITVPTLGVLILYAGIA
jgi:hypothetical protein